MGMEIERKFLLCNNDWKRLAVGIEYIQGYLCSDRQRTVRVRIAGDKGVLTIKGKRKGYSRTEYEYPIPRTDAHHMLNTMCGGNVVEKNRYTIAYKGFLWEIDEFFGLNQGLIVAEIELTSENQVFEIPEWIGNEVTGELKYYNSQLAIHPFSTWPDIQ